MFNTGTARMRNAKKIRGMRNPLNQGAKNLKLVVLEDKALMSGWLGDGVRVDWGGGGGCNELKTAKASAVPGKPQQLSSLF